MKRHIKSIVIWGVIVFVSCYAFYNMEENKRLQAQKSEISYSQFMHTVKDKAVLKVVILDNQIEGLLKSGQRFETINPNDHELIETLLDNNVEVMAELPQPPSAISQFFWNFGPILLLVGVWIWYMKKQSTGTNSHSQFGKSKAKLYEDHDNKISFDDVAGVDEAKEEVREVVEFLKDPESFGVLGAKVPRGLILTGSPGCGKTLLGKAIAHEAGVPFYSISGSDFMEMYVGVGAARIRDMFEQAKKSQRCILFIDEIDALGRHRGAGHGGGNDEREQTLNQLLTEMDGFDDPKCAVIVVAATNRPDILDPALLRPGRFDRQVVVGLPSVKGREDILKVHVKRAGDRAGKNIIDESVNLGDIARGTPGFSGADLANLVNEAALLATKEHSEFVLQTHFERAKDRVLMGTERKSFIMTEDEKTMTAYHEAGHAVVGLMSPEHDPVHKVSIIPRGRALGITMFLPERDTVSASIEKLESQISTLFGGRIAEELYAGPRKVTTGAQSDIERATSVATDMVKKWGLSQLGPISFATSGQNDFLGAQSYNKCISEDTLIKVDTEISRILLRRYQVATEILNQNWDKVEIMAKALVKYETIDKEQIEKIMNGTWND